MLSLEKQNAWREQYRLEHPEWQPATEVYAQTIRAYLEPISHLLDVGCGRGGVIEQLAHPLEQVVGMDGDEHSLREHRLQAPRLTALRALPFADGVFDVAIASWVLEHWVEPLLELREIGRVLRPDGVFIFITPNLNHPLLRWNQRLGRVRHLQEQIVSRLYGRGAEDTFPVYYRANTPDRLLELARAADLTLVTLQTISDPSYLAFHPKLYAFNAWQEGKRSAEARIHLVGVMRKG